MVNYQLELEKILSVVDKSDKPLLFLHVCCAPCASYVLKYLEEYFDIIIYFYNPNIDTSDEYYKRARELESFIGKASIKVMNLIIEDYNHGEFLAKAHGLENEKEGGARCKECFYLRLKRTFDFALHHLWKNSFDIGKKIYFCTTLSISPLKNASLINEIGNEIASKYKITDGEYDIEFLPSDFKKNDGYKISCDLSREYGLYRQDFCGCEFSKKEVVVNDFV